jgi:hypothetical protein
MRGVVELKAFSSLFNLVQVRCSFLVVSVVWFQLLLAFICFRLVLVAFLSRPHWFQVSELFRNPLYFDIFVEELDLCSSALEVV